MMDDHGGDGDGDGDVVRLLTLGKRTWASSCDSRCVMQNEKSVRKRLDLKPFL